MVFELPVLPYAYDALEPYIDTLTMQIHHHKHHAAYINNLNAALEQHVEFAGYSLENLLRNVADVPEEIRTAVRNQGGGAYNHDLFWSFMSPRGGGEPKGGLARAIEVSFGNYTSFREAFEKAALSHFGSGWIWLCLRPSGQLAVISTANQDSPVSLGLSPLLGVDIWEHAYYLKYQNRRGEYVANWWNVVDWEEVARRYESVK